MTWQETHERTRIIREVEAFASADMTGALPWNDEWSPYFNGPDGLVRALRSRWQHVCAAQLPEALNELDFQRTYHALRRRNAGVLRILAAHTDVPLESDLRGAQPALAG